ncbi:MAG: histidinol-phosphate transaminase [Candidatus Cloacimonadota bacterium]|nr:MAG: histidinol-phosphate transaminase [Candidatus Cloacimonadota bacterium]
MPVEPRKALDEVRPYIPGKPIEELRRELGIEDEIVKLASNESAAGTSPKAIEAMKKSIEEMYLYPDDVCYYLKRGLAKHLGVAEENIFTGNGSVELILYAPLAYLSSGDEFLTSEQAFLIGKISAKVMGAVFTAVPEKDYKHDLNAMRDALNEKTKIIYLDNPSNPLGTKHSRKEIEDFVYSIPDGILIMLDEAYYEFVRDSDFPDSIQFVKENKNVLILRTFSKIYGLAGMRIGYGIAPPEIISTIRKTRIPFNVSRLGQIAELAALEDEDHVSRTVQLIDEGKKYLSGEFEKMGVFYIPSCTNFITLKPGIDVKKLFAKLQKRGIIIRPLAGYGMPDFIRVTIGTMKQNKRFIKALKEILEKP